MIRILYLGVWQTINQNHVSLSPTAVTSCVASWLREMIVTFTVFLLKHWCRTMSIMITQHISITPPIIFESYFIFQLYDGMNLLVICVIDLALAHVPLAHNWDNHQFTLVLSIERWCLEQKSWTSAIFSTELPWICSRSINIQLNSQSIMVHFGPSLIIWLAKTKNEKTIRI